MAPPARTQRAFLSPLASIARRAPAAALLAIAPAALLAIAPAALLAIALAACGERPESSGSLDGQTAPERSAASGTLAPPQDASDANAPGAAAAGTASPAGGPATGPTAEVLLYFPDGGGTLKPEKREVPWDGGPVEQGRRIVQALLEGPAGAAGGLTACLPRDASLLALYLGDDGTAYVDFDAAFARGLSDGSEDALLAVWSVSDSLAANLPDVRRVKILVEGEEVRDLGGHLDLSRPLVPGMAMR